MTIAHQGSICSLPQLRQKITPTARLRACPVVIRMVHSPKALKLPLKQDAREVSTVTTMTEGWEIEIEGVHSATTSDSVPLELNSEQRKPSLVQADIAAVQKTGLEDVLPLVTITVTNLADCSPVS